VGSISLASDFAWAVECTERLLPSNRSWSVANQKAALPPGSFARRGTVHAFFLISLLESAAILLMGSMVTPIVLAVLMPIIEINQLVHGSTRACK
jgi:hypothetical protein